MDALNDIGHLLQCICNNITGIATIAIVPSTITTGYIEDDRFCGYEDGNFQVFIDGVESFRSQSGQITYDPDTCRFTAVNPFAFSVSSEIVVVRYP